MVAEQGWPLLGCLQLSKHLLFALPFADLQKGLQWNYLIQWEVRPRLETASAQTQSHVHQH